MKGEILACALLLTGCTSTQLAYTFGNGISPQRAQELAAQQEQKQYEAQQAAVRQQRWETRCERNFCTPDWMLRPKAYSCSDSGLTEAQRLACDLPGITVTNDLDGNIVDLGVE